MKRLPGCLLAALSVLPCSAQLSLTQKSLDFQELVALFAKRYSFVEWKRDALSYDGLNISPWLERIAQTKDDLEFFEICTEYVSKYQDGHAGFFLPSTFEAKLGFTVDLYDGKALVDSIDRKILNETDFPFAVGDELISLDGKTPVELIPGLLRFVNNGNLSSARREAAGLITWRTQDAVPRAHELGASGVVVIRKRGGQATQSYTIPWVKSGRPYIFAGPVPTPKTAAGARFVTAPLEDEGPRYMRRVRQFQNLERRPARAVNGIGRTKPLFDLPESFTPRLGNGRFDSYFSGTFDVEGTKVAFIRIPSLSGLSVNTFENEVKFFSENSDGLVVDVMSNPGGSICTTQRLLQRVMPEPFRMPGSSLRSTWDLVIGSQQDLDDAVEFDADPEEIATLRDFLKANEEAYQQSRGLTRPISLCGSSLDVDPSKDTMGVVTAYKKPLMVLTDEFSASAAELFAATIQDNQRGIVYGSRTNGAGGARGDADVGFYMEGYATLARSILIRKDPIVTREFPAAPYIENIGIVPEQAAGYMTEDNLVNKGKTFVEGFTAAMVKYIKAK